MYIPTQSEMTVSAVIKRVSGTFLHFEYCQITSTHEESRVRVDPTARAFI